MNLFQCGKFKLASGQSSTWKVECDALMPEDWAALARIAVDVLPPFGRAVGVPRGGLRFAFALTEYRIEGHPRVLIADDVWTTGGSMIGLAQSMELMDSTWHGVVAFARGPLRGNVTAVWKLYGR